MKKIIPVQLKSLRYILGYWIILVVAPFLIALFMYNGYIKYLNRGPELIIFYILFIAPFLYFIPYQIVKPKAKAAFIIWGVVIPYLFIYLFIYLLVYWYSKTPMSLSL